ncbi:MAG TPA: hypothetical protein VJI13_02045 [Candidatus Norongarragalinales archaeon]|nr:hypothetical protein [Candidatus Norongarragalinales archaeon]
MDEKGLVYALAFVGIVTLALQTYVASQNAQKIREALPPLLESALCYREGGSVLLSLPANVENCRKIEKIYRNFGSNLCDFFPNRRGSCEKIAEIADERYMDCIGGLFSNEYKYSEGYPQAEQYCKEFEG